MREVDHARLERRVGAKRPSASAAALPGVPSGDLRHVAGRAGFEHCPWPPRTMFEAGATGYVSEVSRGNSWERGSRSARALGSHSPFKSSVVNLPHAPTRPMAAVGTQARLDAYLRIG